jgi:hypothetical protein
VDDNLHPLSRTNQILAGQLRLVESDIHPLSRAHLTPGQLKFRKMIFTHYQELTEQ